MEPPVQSNRRGQDPVSEAGQFHRDRPWIRRTSLKVSEEFGPGAEPDLYAFQQGLQWPNKLEGIEAGGQPDLYASQGGLQWPIQAGDIEPGGQPDHYNSQGGLQWPVQPEGIEAAEQPAD